MTRRQAVLALSAVMAAIAGKVEAQNVQYWNGKIAKSTVTFDVASYTKYIFTLDSKQVEFTPEELFAALEAK